MVEEMLAFRGIEVSHETIRQWGLGPKGNAGGVYFGQAFANIIRRRLPRPGDKWHLDEVVPRIAGKTHYLWRAVDQHGIVLDVLVQSRRGALAILCPRENPKIQDARKNKAIRRTGAKGQLKSARRNKNRLGFNLPSPSPWFFGFSNGLSI